MNPAEEDRLMWYLFVALMGIAILGVCVGVGVLMLAIIIACVVGE